MEEQNQHPPEPYDVSDPADEPEQAEAEPTDEEQEAEEQHAADHLVDNLAGLGGAADAALDAPANEQEWEKRFATAEKRFATYSRAITALWEEDAVHLAPISISPSAPPGFIDVRDAGRVPDELKDPVMEFLGFPREQEYEPDPAAHTCGTCKGKGRTSTGSLLASEASRLCPKCGGRGWEQENEQGANGNATTNLKTWANDLPVGEPLTAGGLDPWGEPEVLPNGELNENYGKMPQYKKQHPKYGVTARERAELTG